MTALELAHIEQGSEDWIAARVGLVTASRCYEMANTTQKGEWTAKREAYRDELICERLTGQPFPRHITPEMEWGTLQEPFARAAYEIRYGILVDTVGFVIHPENDRFGASPDGYVGEDGLIQIKCPGTRKHLERFLLAPIPPDYATQMLAELACTGRKWCDLVSYDPRLPGHLQLYVTRYQPEEKFIRALEAQVVHFNAEIEGVLAALPQGPQPIATILEMTRGDELEF